MLFALQRALESRPSVGVAQVEVDVLLLAEKAPNVRKDVGDVDDGKVAGRQVAGGRISGAMGAVVESGRGRSAASHQERIPRHRIRVDLRHDPNDVVVAKTCGSVESRRLAWHRGSRVGASFEEGEDGLVATSVSPLNTFLRMHILIYTKLLLALHIKCIQADMYFGKFSSIVSEWIYQMEYANISEGCAW